ncbi:MAG: ABC transporter ATP-binding protein [Bradyrhizobiaceae bacterium]|nr:MAG: ABC transporter ATP-binding protein [Bradyrhizobiaceae bacterium]
MSDAGVALSLSGVSKRFGGLVAVDGVTIDFASRRLNAIIGPNGAGKTTLFNLISGEIPADAGRMRFRDSDILGLAPHEVVRRGISRTLQIKSVFGGLTVTDNVRCAVLVHERVMAPLRPVSSFRAAAARADALIDEVGLSAHRHRLASTLSYGDVALLELALALAAEPRLLLLDEPVCGMGPQETERTVDKIREISRRVDVILIEHDMEVVFDIADFIMVMAQGAILATGAASEIAAHPKVQEAYLGSPEDD